MSYSLGLDLGTTSSAAAVNDGSTVRMLSVDHSAAVIPSVVHLDAEGAVVVGSAAERRAISDPGGVAREFKRRFGDPQPLILSGSPVAANDLMLEIATELVDIATQQMGEAPEQLVVCHPANWGSYKLGLLSDTLNNSALPPHTLITEPEAAAIHYASQERVADGEVIAVYDLGGGTFDAVVLRKTEANASGWDILGEPRGIERLGGIDFDLAVLTHVIGVLNLDLDSFDSEDASNQAAMTRFREECRAAKHALSSDVSATVPVLLPGYNETVRITRREFEQLIDPAIGRTIDTLDVAVSTTGLEMGAVDRILLVGGSTRVPLVAARLSSRTNRPVKSDAHPKHAMALGAATLAGLTSTTPADSTPPADDAPDQATAEPSPAPTSKPAAPSHSELYSLPHIDEEPLPSFMKSPAPAPPSAPSTPSTPSTPSPPSAPSAPTPPSGPPSTPTPAPAPAPLAPPAPAAATAAPAPPAQPHPTAPTPTVGPVIVEDRPERSGRSPIAIFLLSFVVVGALLAAALFALGLGGDEDGASPSESADPAETEDSDASSADESTTTTVETSPTTEVLTIVAACSDDQFADPDTRYQVTLIPERFGEPTLNGRNVPSTDAVDGVDSRPITAFAELTELDIVPEACSVADNGTVWWGVDYDGPDDAGGTFTGTVWSATVFIEPVPGQ